MNDRHQEIEAEITDLRDALHRPLEESATRSGLRIAESPQPRTLPLAVYATDDKLAILVPISGIDPEDVEISLDRATLTLLANVSIIVDTEGVQEAIWYLNELESAEYRRSVTLPFEVDTEPAEASMDQGVLRIELPMSERAKPQRIAVGGGTKQQIKDLERFPTVATLGNAVYTPEGLHLFLTSPAERFDGRTALDLLHGGEEDRVVSALASDYEAVG
jgi:HSP20 family protein